jgi:hypothetical protein
MNAPIGVEIELEHQLSKLLTTARTLSQQRDEAERIRDAAEVSYRALVVENENAWTAVCDAKDELAEFLDFEIRGGSEAAKSEATATPALTARIIFDTLNPHDKLALRYGHAPAWLACPLVTAHLFNHQFCELTKRHAIAAL